MCKLFSSDNWIPVPMVSAEAVAAGFAGGEGCRQVLCPVLDPVEGKYALFGTDIGGLYRSVDGGRTWSVATLGLDSAGATGAAFDPRNPSRCVIVGANSASQSVNGIFLSTDYGESWIPTLRADTCNRRAFNTQLAYDPTSYDDKLGYCKVLYWSREDDDKCRYARNNPSLYKSIDGGESWQRIPDTERLGSADIAVHSVDGRVIVANKNGVFRSSDGCIFEQILDISACTMSSIATLPDMLYIAAADGIYISENFGDSFYVLRGSNYPLGKPHSLRVSPANPLNMVIQDYRGAILGESYKHVTLYSKDGGKSWLESLRITDESNPGWCAKNAAMNGFCWHPTNPDKLICCWTLIYSSDDGGATYKYSSTGFSGITGSSQNHFNVNNSDLISFSSGDFNGALSTDGGNTWRYIEWSGQSWGGYINGSYCLNENTIVAAERNSRTHKHNISVTFDGGKSVIKTDVIVNNPPVCTGALANDNIAFIGEWRTVDGGHTWHIMKNCIGVYCNDFKDGMLFGKNYEGNIVFSVNDGESFELLCQFGDNITSMCYNYNRRILYVTDGSLVYYIDLNDSVRCPKVLSGFTYAQLAMGVAVDPTNPDIMYISCKSDKNYRNRNIWRSLDGGQSFICLTRDIGDGRNGLDGARRPTGITVNAKTGELFVFTCGKGVWKLPKPQL